MPPWRRLGRPGRHLGDAPSDPGTPSPPPTGAPAATDPVPDPTGAPATVDAVAPLRRQPSADADRRDHRSGLEHAKGARRPVSRVARGRSAAASPRRSRSSRPRGFFYKDAPAFEEVDALAARGGGREASGRHVHARRARVAVGRSIARKQAPRRLGADSDNAAFERPRPSGANSGDTAASLGRIGSDRCHGLDCCSRRKPAASQQARVRRSLRETKRHSPITASADDS